MVGDWGGKSTTQSYDLMCIVPKSSLLKTVIPGWLCRGITPDGGKQNIPIYTTHSKNIYNKFTIIFLLICIFCTFKIF